MDLIHALRGDWHNLLSKEVNVVARGQVRAIYSSVHKPVIVKSAHLLVQD